MIRTTCNYVRFIEGCTPLERKLFLALSKNLGQTTPHEDIEKAVWGDRDYRDQTVRDLIARLRAKVAGYLNGKFEVINEWGVGYALINRDSKGEFYHEGSSTVRQ